MAYTLKQLRYFVAAAEGGGVSAAARACHVSQPSVSAAIGQLEAAFGVQLFVRRHAQGLALTPAGRRLVATARSLLAHAGELSQTAIGLGQGLVGEIDVGCFATFAPFVLPGLLRVFAERHPEIRVRIHEGDLQALMDGLREGRFEVALTYGLGLGDDLAFDALRSVPAHAVLPADHRLARRRRVALADLAGEPLVLLALPRSREYFLSLFHNLGLAPTIAYETSSHDMLRGLVANGYGCALMHSRPDSDEALDGKRLAYRVLSDAVRPERLGLARVARNRPTRMAEAFAATCAAALPAGAVSR